MTLIRLDRTGHTELELGTDEMIRELEKDMNAGKVAVAEEPGKVPVYLREAAGHEYGVRDPRDRWWRWSDEHDAWVLSPSTDPTPVSHDVEVQHGDIRCP